MSAAVMEQNLSPQTSILEFFSSPNKPGHGYSKESDQVKSLNPPIDTSTPKPGKGKLGKRKENGDTRPCSKSSQSHDKKKETSASLSKNKDADVCSKKSQGTGNAKTYHMGLKAKAKGQKLSSATASQDEDTGEMVLADCSGTVELDEGTDIGKSEYESPAPEHKMEEVRVSQTPKKVTKGKEGKKKERKGEAASDEEDDTSFDCDYTKTLTEGDTDSGLIHEKDGAVLNTESARKKRKKKRKKSEELNPEDEAQKVEKLVATMTDICSKTGKKRKTVCEKSLHTKCDCSETYSQTSCKRTMDSYLLKAVKQTPGPLEECVDVSSTEEDGNVMAKQKLSPKKNAGKRKKAKGASSKSEDPNAGTKPTATEEAAGPQGAFCMEEKKTHVEMTFEEYMSSLAACNEDEKADEPDGKTFELSQDDNCLEATKESEREDKTSATTGAKAYPSVMNFFLPVKEKPAEESSMEEDETNVVTVKADIHPPPEAKPSTGKQGKKRDAAASRTSPVSSEDKHIKTDDIEVLSSEIIAAEEITDKAVKKSSSAKSFTVSDSDEKPEGEVKLSLEEASSKSKLIDVETQSFLKKVENVVVKKSSQATLNFGQNGLETNTKKLIKAVILEKEELTTEEDVTQAEDQTSDRKAPYSSETASTSKRGRRRKAVKVVPPSPAPAPVKTVPKEAEDSTPVAGKDETPRKGTEKVPVGEGTPVRRSTRRRTHTDVFLYHLSTQPTRRSTTKTVEPEEANTSIEDQDFTPKSAKAATTQTKSKQATAQALLRKAKQQQTRRSQSVEARPPPAEAKDRKKRQAKEWQEIMPSRPERTKRPSAQLAGQLIHMQQSEVIVIDGVGRRPSEELTPSKSEGRSRPGRKRRLPDVVLVDDEDEGSPKKKKAPKRIAPIFEMGKGGKAGAETKAPPEDPEKVRRRQDFLMSGLPKPLIKQMEASSATCLPEFPPLPRVSHVLQAPDPLTEIWRLPPVTLPLTAEEEECPPLNTDWSPLLSRDWRRGDATVSLQTLKNFTKHPETDVKPLVQEIQQLKQSFSAEEMYNRLKAKQQAQEKLDSSVAGKVETKPAPAPEPETPRPKSTTRQSSRKRELSPDCVMVEETRPLPEASVPPSKGGAQSALRDLLWTDVFQPHESCEILGNTASVKRLRSWLVEWRQSMRREASKKKRRLKRGKPAAALAEESSSQGWGGEEEDSDFDFRSEVVDSEDEEACRLCNTTLLAGPHGVGKTMAVYALAKELGYKVFEVNASSPRNGKLILSQLREATQSHQVGQNREGMAAPAAATPSSQATPSTQATPSGEKAKVQAAFLNLFKSAETSGKAGATPKSSSKKARVEVIDVEKTTPTKRGRGRPPSKSAAAGRPGAKRKASVSSPGKRGRKAAIEEDSASQGELSAPGSLNLTSTSLILFDDVDLVLESDKGFLQAVQHFMAVSKIPIVMTATSSSFADQLRSRVEVLQFKTPPYGLTASLLQILGLVHGVRISHSDLLSLVALLRGDVRRCILALQFWVQSGGGCVQVPRKLAVPAACKSVDQDSEPASSASQQSSTAAEQAMVASDDEDDDDFVCLRPAVRRRGRQVVEDDAESRDSVSGDVNMEEGEAKEEEMMENKGDGPTMHCQCMESVLSLGPTPTLKSALTAGLQSEDGLPLAAQACSRMNPFNDDLYHSNLLHFLPLPHAPPDGCQILPASKPAPVSAKQSGFRRIKDLYDSEGSDGEESSQKSHSQPSTVASVAAVIGGPANEGRSPEGVEMEECVDERQACGAEDMASQPASSAEPGDVEMAEASSEVSLSQEAAGDAPEASERNTQDSDAQDKEAEGKPTADAEMAENAPELMTENLEQNPESNSVPMQTGDSDMETNEVAVKKAPSTSAEASSEKKGFSKEGKCEWEMLAAMANYHDTLSGMDTMAAADGLRDLDQPVMRAGHRSRLEAGLQDHQTLYEKNHWWSGVASNELTSDLQVRAARRLCAEVKDLASSYREAHPDSELPQGCHVPEVKGCGKFSPSCQQSSVSRQRAVENVSACLPPSRLLQPSALHQDYMPSLRTISRTMQLRCQAKVKRRFHHYFDLIGLRIKESTRNVLCSEFNQ